MSYLLAQASAHAIPLRDESVQTCVTSPPYWGLRAYAGEQRFVWGGDVGCDHVWRGLNYLPKGIHCDCGAWYGALGLEPTPELYVEHMVEVFREVKRVLRKDGTLWLNLGDSYASGAMGFGNSGGSYEAERDWGDVPRAKRDVSAGLKPKDLVGIPWRVAFALQADGWYLRSDIIWAKPNPMPESVTDRPTKSHEYLFLLTKSARYYFDADAIREPHTRDWSNEATGGVPNPDRRDGGDRQSNNLNPAGRNARSVWNIATQPYPGAHFATFPEELPRRCILAGSSQQACDICGSPWARVTSVEYVKNRPSAGDDPRSRGEDRLADEGARGHGGWRGNNLLRDVQTTGFRPTCTHASYSGKGLVLDPFNGSGTTGAVALRLGRSYVGLDLSREYLSEQALARIDPLAAAAQAARNGTSEQQVLAL